MNKLMISSLCCIFTLQAMENPLSGIIIRNAEEKDIFAMTALHNQVTNDFFKPKAYLAYEKYGKELITKVFNMVDDYYHEFFQKATSETDDDGYLVVIATPQDFPEKVYGLCCCIRRNAGFAVDYFIVSQEMCGKGMRKAFLNKVLAEYDDIMKFHEKEMGFTRKEQLISFFKVMPINRILTKSSLFSIVTFHGTQKSSDDIVIRKAEKKDMPAVTALAENLPIKSAFDDEIDCDPDYNNPSDLLVITSKESAENILGFYSFAQNGHSLLFEYYALCQELRNKKIGKSLVTKIREMVSKEHKGICFELLEFVEGNENAPGYYNGSIGGCSNWAPEAYVTYQLDIKK